MATPMPMLVKLTNRDLRLHLELKGPGVKAGVLDAVMMPVPHIFRHRMQQVRVSNAAGQHSHSENRHQGHMQRHSLRCIF